MAHCELLWNPSWNEAIDEMSNIKQPKPVNTRACLLLMVIKYGVKRPEGH